MTDIQAALGLSQLQRLDEVVEERNRQLVRYKELLIDQSIEFLSVPEGIKSSVHLAVVRLPQVTAVKHRKVFEAMRAAGLGVQLHYTPVHLHPYYRSLGFIESQYPEAEKYSKSAISLPLFPGLTNEEQSRVACSLLNFLNE